MTKKYYVISLFCILLTATYMSLKDTDFIRDLSLFNNNPHSDRVIAELILESEIQPKPVTTVNTNLFRKVLSYCVFGALQNYGDSIESILKESAISHFYRTWSVMLFTDIDVSDNLVQIWRQINPRFSIINVRNLTEYPNLQYINAMTWRFVPVGFDDVDISCIRDLDSPLLKREEAAVKEYLLSNHIFHGMRDNPHHHSKIMGGMWCFRNMKNRKLGKTLLKRVLHYAERRDPGSKEATKGNDQDVLNKHFWPFIVDDSMTHDSFICHWGPTKNVRSFPTKRNGDKFVGCVRPCIYDLKALICPDRCRPRLHQDWIYC